MSESSAGVRPAWLPALTVAATTAACVIGAALVMFSAFMFYDDEGYVLLSLRNFAEHGGLYRDVYTQYGPFPFVFHSALSALGIPLTHTVGRLITLGAWTGTAVAAGALVAFATRNLLLRLLVVAAVFVYLWVMANEPSHPGGIIVVTTVLIAAAGYRWIAGHQLSRWAGATGAVTAVLLLTKVNVGVFLAYAACSWWLLHHAHDGLRRWALPLTAAWSAALPFVLMRPLLGTPWVLTYAIVFAGSAVAVMLVTGAHATGRTRWGMLGIGLVAAAAVTVVVLGVVLLRGTGPRDLLDGMLLAPLRQPTVFSLRFVWPPGIRAIAAVSLIACVAACAFRRRHRGAIDQSVAVLRVLVAAALFVNLVRFPFIRPDYLSFGFALPCLWLFVWPLAGEASAVTSARSWVALVLLGQCLHVFPVPGSQIAWGSVLVLPLAALGGWDASTWLARQPRGGWLARRSWILAGRLALLVLLALTGWRFSQVAARYREGQNLQLPGAEMIRLPAPATALFRVLTLNAVVHGDMLFSLPGMFSLNLWTGLPTPTHANVTHWFSLLSDEKQRAIIQQLESHPRACLVVDRGHVAFLADHQLQPRGILYDYLAENFQPAFTIDRLEFCVHRGRSIEPLMLGEILARADGTVPKDAPPEDRVLRMTLLLPPNRPVARVEIAAVPDATKGPLVLDARSARIEVAPATIRSQPTAGAAPGTWPLTLPGPAIVSFYYRREGKPQPSPGALVIFRDAAGEEIGLGRLRD